MTTTKAKRPAKSAKTVLGETTTPTGQPGIVIQCTCATHGANNRAIMRAVCRPGLEADPERIHGYVTLAWHPALSRAPQIRNNGPWQA